MITPEQSLQFFREDSAPLLAKVGALPILEGAALASFAFNCGPGALARVTSGAVPLSQFTHNAKGGLEPGLVSRRRLEGLLIALSKQLAAGK